MLPSCPPGHFCIFPPAFPDNSIICASIEAMAGSRSPEHSGSWNLRDFPRSQAGLKHASTASQPRKVDSARSQRPVDVLLRVARPVTATREERGTQDGMVCWYCVIFVSSDFAICAFSDPSLSFARYGYGNGYILITSLYNRTVSREFPDSKALMSKTREEKKSVEPRRLTPRQLRMWNRNARL